MCSGVDKRFISKHWFSSQWTVAVRTRLAVRTPTQLAVGTPTQSATLVLKLTHVRSRQGIFRGPGPRAQFPHSMQSPSLRAFDYSLCANVPAREKIKDIYQGRANLIKPFVHLQTYVLLRPKLVACKIYYAILGNRYY